MRRARRSQQEQGGAEGVRGSQGEPGRARKGQAEPGAREATRRAYVFFSRRNALYALSSKTAEPTWALEAGFSQHTRV